MSWFKAKWKLISVVTLVLIIAALAAAIKIQASAKALLEKDNATLISERDQAQSIFKNYQAAILLFNDIAKATQDEKEQAKRDSETRIVYIREALKGDACAAQPVPDAAIKQLRDHANKVRAG
ncbi:hypothetical protein ACL2XP_17965 [Sodalis sp. RH21]|uniref:hypothetical protein n=1 Tax=unclassified Sodalis (in: enterobacteria) TaxID=2636512 RepID=UPI0039B6443B